MDLPTRTDDWWMRFDDWLRPLALRGWLEELSPGMLRARFGDRLPEAFTRNFVPALDVAETANSVILKLEAPGMVAGDFDVQVVGDQLVISGEKRVEERTDDKKLRRVETQHGRFSRSITLPMEVRTGAIEAIYEKGILTVTVPKTAPTPATKVKIQAK